MDNLEADCWYWVSHYSEGDIFYPAFVGSNGTILMDGNKYSEKDVSGLTFTKAIMPEIEHG